MRTAMLEVALIVVPLIGILVGITIMIAIVRERKIKQAVFGEVRGVLKQDWARTGRIDFHLPEVESTSPQLILRVEEQKITENAMGQDMKELRWRLATLDEGKELVVHWNGSKAERSAERRGAFLRST